MVKQKVVMTKSESTINSYLDDGWIVKHVVPQVVSSSGTGSWDKEGEICFVIEKTI